MPNTERKHTLFVEHVFCYVLEICMHIYMPKKYVFACTNANVTMRLKIVGEKLKNIEIFIIQWYVSMPKNKNPK